MTTRSKFAVLTAGLLIAFGAGYGSARGQVMTPRPDTVRFQMVTNEPVAAPDNRSVVAGWSAMVIKDRLTRQCFAAVTEGESMSTTPVNCP